MADNPADRPALENDDALDYGALSLEQRDLISRKMLAAGLAAYLEHDSRFDADEEAVARIFCAMISAKD